LKYQASGGRPPGAASRKENDLKATVTKEPQTTTTALDRAQRLEYVAPEVNIIEANDAYVVEAEMPGVNKDGLDITLEGTELAIVGHRSLESLPGEPVFKETTQADYRRVFDLDPAIDTSKISAKMDQGILTLTLPKSEKVKPRKIAVSE
jgi:HSP20 family protein